MEDRALASEGAGGNEVSAKTPEHLEHLPLQQDYEQQQLRQIQLQLQQQQQQQQQQEQQHSRNNSSGNIFGGPHAPPDTPPRLEDPLGLFQQSMEARLVRHLQRLEEKLDHLTAVTAQFSTTSARVAASSKATSGADATLTGIPLSPAGSGTGNISVRCIKTQGHITATLLDDAGEVQDTSPAARKESRKGSDRRVSVESGNSDAVVGQSSSERKGLFHRSHSLIDRVSAKQLEMGTKWFHTTGSGTSIHHKVTKRLGVDQAALDEQTKKQPACGYQIIHSGPANIIFSLVIVLNAIFIGYESAVNLNSHMNGDEYPSWLPAVEVTFSVWFLLEWAARLVAERWLFFVGSEWKWNAFDTLLMLTSLADLIASSRNMLRAYNLTMGRLLRLLRFFRIARISRVIRQFASLRLVLFSVLDSMVSLFWCFVIIGITVYVFAVLFVNACNEHFQDVGANASDSVSQTMKEFYGGIYTASVTLFMTMTGGIDWKQAMDPLGFVYAPYERVLIFYIFLMQFGVLNVVVGTFVATATEIASKDREAFVKAELRSWELSTCRIKTFFHEADVDKSGTLSWEEFRNHLQNPTVRAYFNGIGLDVSQAHALFELLDTDGNDSVTIDEFLDGCMRLKGEAKSVDTHMLHMMVQRMSERLNKHIKRSETVTSDVRFVLEASPPTSQVEVGDLREVAKNDPEAAAASAPVLPTPVPLPTSLPGTVAQEEKVNSSSAKKRSEKALGPGQVPRDTGFDSDDEV